MPMMAIADLWEPADLHVVTTNSAIRRDGALVMGRGAAKQAVKRFGTRLQYRAGELVHHRCGNLGFYGFILVDVPWLGLFQVKYKWSEPASLKLIEESVAVLKCYADANPRMQIRMNYPGIGNGQLEARDVNPLLLTLPDNVTVCRYAT